MVTKKKSTGEKEAKRGRIEVGKLKLNKETVKDLTTGEKKKVRGAAIGNATANNADLASYCDGRCPSRTCFSCHVRADIC